jgi:hypothetical protein
MRSLTDEDFTDDRGGMDPHRGTRASDPTVRARNSSGRAFSPNAREPKHNPGEPSATARESRHGAFHSIASIPGPIYNRVSAAGPPPRAEPEGR